MSEGKPRLARLTAILTLLQSKRLVTAREIAEKHDVSIRTVYRDMRTLEQSGIPLFTEEGKGYSIMDGYKLPPVMFTEEEANALITAEHIISKNKDTSLTDFYSSAIIKIRAVLKGNQRSKTDLLNQRIEVRDQGLFQTSSYLMRIQSAITNYQLISIHYLSEKGEESTRDIEPFALYHTQDNWVLIAFCRLRKDFRAFRLDRMSRLTTKNQGFAPHELTLQEYFDEVRKKWKNNP